MRDYKQEFENRVAFIKNILADSGAKGLVYGTAAARTLLWLESFARQPVTIPLASSCPAAQSVTMIWIQWMP